MNETPLSTTYRIEIRRIDVFMRDSREYEKVADSGNTRDGGAQYEYVTTQKRQREETDILKQEVPTLDLAAVIVARCGGPRRFAKLNEAIFAGQATWLPRGAEFARTNRETLAKAEPPAQLRGLAEASGLLAIGRAQGLTDAALGRCFADRAAIDRVVASTRAVPSEVTGTPAFFVNGRYTGAHDWTRLQPLLAAR